MTKDTLSASCSDRFLVHVSHNPERVRMALLDMEHRPWVFVVQTDSTNPNYGYDIYISNEWGSYPDDELYNRCLTFANNLLAEDKSPVVVTDEYPAADDILLEDRKFNLLIEEDKAEPIVEVELIEEEKDQPKDKDQTK